MRLGRDVGDAAEEALEAEFEVGHLAVVPIDVKADKIAVDGNRLYYRAAAALWSIPTTGGTPSTVWTQGGDAIASFVVDDTAIYIAIGSKRIVRVCKPL